MTTIAYRSGVIADDTLSTSNGHVVSRSATKIGKRGSFLWGVSGCAAYGWRFREWCQGVFRGAPPEPTSDDSGGSLYLPDCSLLSVGFGGCELRKGVEFWAEGSGADYAIGAMSMGASPIEAVGVAQRWDTRTGSRIVVLRR